MAQNESAMLDGGKDLLELVSKRAVVEEQIGNLVTFLRGRTLFEFNTGKILVGKMFALAGIQTHHLQTRSTFLFLKPGTFWSLSMQTNMLKKARPWWWLSGLAKSAND